MQDKKERRLHKRVPFVREIVINNKILAKSIDLSEGGLFVQTDRTFLRGNSIEITLPLKDIAITVKAIILRTHSGVGMAMKFFFITDEQKGLIKKQVESLSSQVRHDHTEKQTILFIEDSETTRRVYKNKLVSEGFNVVEAKDGYEAIAYLNTAKTDLIVLDLHMEIIDGFKMLSMINESEKWKNVPVIVLSSQSSQDTISKVIAAGADKFMAKMMTTPFKLAEAVQNLLKIKKS